MIDSFLIIISYVNLGMYRPNFLWFINKKGENLGKRRQGQQNYINRQQRVHINNHIHTFKHDKTYLSLVIIEARAPILISCLSSFVSLF